MSCALRVLECSILYNSLSRDEYMLTSHSIPVTGSIYAYGNNNYNNYVRTPSQMLFLLLTVYTIYSLKRQTYNYYLKTIKDWISFSPER